MSEPRYVNYYTQIVGGQCIRRVIEDGVTLSPPYCTVRLHNNKVAPNHYERIYSYGDAIDIARRFPEYDWSIAAYDALMDAEPRCILAQSHE